MAITKNSEEHISSNCHDVISNFEGKYYFLSNYFRCQFIFEGLQFFNAEAAFQAMKTSSALARRAFCGLHPNEAKALGRKIELREDWKEIKDRVMYSVVKAKFSQNPKLMKQLLLTRDAHLIEGNSWGDNYWGISPYNSLTQENKNNNHLGKILMQVRCEANFDFDIICNKKY